MASSSNQAKQIDIDELAREKVKEVENLLEQTIEHKTDVIDSSFQVLKQIITAADLHRTNDNNDKSSGIKDKIEGGESIYADYADDNEQFNAVDLTEQFASNSVKWTIRVQAFKLVHRLVRISITSNRLTTTKTFLSRHLSDLVRLSFVAATSPYDDLKLQGFEMFKLLINRFAHVEEKEFPGHSILEQYRTQFLSALKPSFNLDAPPYITAIASQVCCQWICRGLERDSIGLERAFNLMTSTIDKLENQSVNQNNKLYTESELEQERLDILGSWAQLYITSNESEELNQSRLLSTFTKPVSDTKLLSDLVKPHMDFLVDRWWEALRDYALLIMPAHRGITSSHDKEHVYTKEVALRLFEPIWPKLILASTIWLCNKNSRTTMKTNNQRETSNQKMPIPSHEVDQNYDINHEHDGSINLEGNSLENQNNVSSNQSKYFKFVCGILLRELCRCQSDDSIEKDTLPESTVLTLRSLVCLVSNHELPSLLLDDLMIFHEFYITLYGIFIKRAKPRSQYSQILKFLIENMFSLLVRKLINITNCIEYSLVFQIKGIANDLRAIENAIKSSNIMDSETAWLVLSIRQTNIMTILKLAPIKATSHEDLRRILVDGFCSIIRFKEDVTIGVNLIETLKSVQFNIPQEHQEFFSNHLLRPESDVMNHLLRSLSHSDNKFKTVYIEVFMKAIKHNLANLSPKQRKEALESHLSAICTSIEALYTFKPPKEDAKLNEKKKELMDLTLKHIKDIKGTYRDEYDVILTSQMKDILEKAEDAQEAKISTEAKQKLAANKTSASNRSKQPAKIVLKADFSNYYAKKA